MTPVSGAINSALEAVGIGEGSNSGLVNALTDWSGWGSKGSTWMMDKGMSLVTKGWDTAGSSLMSLGQTVQGVDTWLKSIPGMSGGIGSAAGYLGSIVSLTQGKYGSAAGSAIGTAILPGVGTMIGGFLGGLVDDLFGGDSIPRFGATAEYKGGQVARGWMPDGQWHNDAYNSVSTIAASIGGALDATAKPSARRLAIRYTRRFQKMRKTMVFSALCRSPGRTERISLIGPSTTKTGVVGSSAMAMRGKGIFSGACGRSEVSVPENGSPEMGRSVAGCCQ